MTNRLTANNLSKRFKQRTVVKGVSLSVEAGEVVGLLGPNGAGKTTTFYLISGLVLPDHGQVMLNNEDITAFPMHKRALAGLGYLPQEASVFRQLTVEDNIMAVLETLPLSREERDTQLASLLDEFGLQHIRDTFGISLSGGERRRVEIARALATKPKFILLDEPFAGVDPLSVRDIKQQIRYLASRGIGILITDHNVRETLGICDRAGIVNEGNIIAMGTVEAILSDDLVREVYLGKEFSL